MRTRLLPFVCLLSAASICTHAFANEEEVRRTFSGYLEAFNKRHVEALAQMLSENSVHVDRETGTRTEGRQAIQKDLEATFKMYPTIQLSGHVDRVRVIQPTVAQAEGETLVVGGADAQPVGSRFSAILVKGDSGWKIDSVEESPLPRPNSAYEALRELEWLIGRWVDESAEVRVETTFRWSTNQSFLLRSYVVRLSDGTERQGTQVIGWDPRSREIRSWSFNADGSFGDGVWSRNGDGWLIRSSQTLADGRAASGTYVMTRIDDATMTTQLLGHEIEGEPQPAGEAVTMVRAIEPPSPATSDRK